MTSKFKYDIKDFTKGLSFYYNYIMSCDPSFFSKNKANLVYTPTEILNIISKSKILDSSKTNYYSHQFFEDAIESINFYEKKLNSQMSPEVASNTSELAYLHILNIVGQIIYIFLKYWKDSLEKKIHTKTHSEALKIILSEQQKIRDEDYYPLKLKNDYLEYLNNRFNDFKKLNKIEQSDYSSEIKKILESYNQSLETNLKGKDLLNPLIQKKYDDFISKIKNLLLIPSSYDIYESDKERFFHVYLLGILEGRMALYKTTSNQESGLGRYDICLSPINKKNPGVIIEIKKIDSGNIETHLERALNQIKEKIYTYSLESDGVKEILIISLLFKGKEPFTKMEIIKK